MKFITQTYFRRIPFIAILITVALFYTQQGIAQEELVEQINLPKTTDGGNTPFDILVANNYVFVYTGSKIEVYNTNMVFVKEISLSEKDYGKFNPVYYDPRLHGETNMMAYNPGKQLLYVVSPELEIRQYMASGNFSLVSTLPPPTTINHFKPIHGLNIIKFDKYHNRLYWLVKGKIGNHDTGGNFNCDGQFHIRERYFAIFDVTDNTIGEGTLLTPHFEEQMKSKVKGESGLVEYNRYINSSVSDVEFNQTNNLFYLTKLTKMEIWRVTDGSAEIVDSLVIDTINYGGPYYKFGQMKYIKESNPSIHKIIALPYRYPSANENNIPLMIVLDGGEMTFDNADIIEVQSRKILDATYLKDHQDLILSYAPDSKDIMDWAGLDKTADLAIFHFNNNATGASFQYVTTIKTDGQNINKSKYDFNTSFQLTRVNSSTALVSRKDQVVQIKHTGNGNYTSETKFKAEGNYFYKGASFGSNAYIVNAASGTVEFFTENSHNTVRMGYPVNNIVANTTGSKMYMFNKLNTANSGLYIADVNPEEISVQNINDGSSTNNLPGMIGDVVYNPYQQHFLVAQSDVASDDYYIQIINDNASNDLPAFNKIVMPTDDGDIRFPKEMFLGPDRRLYVMAHLIETGSGKRQPYVLVYDADDPQYALLYKKKIDALDDFPDEFEYFTANFSYNAYNNKVYATIHPTEYTLDPYVSVPNSMFDYNEPYFTSGTGAGAGIFIRFEDTDISIVNEELLFPGKVICPISLTTNAHSQYDGKMFVIGKNFQEFDFMLSSPTNSTYDKQYNDILYSPELDMLFALSDVEGECSMDRRIQIDKIYYDDDVLTFEQLDLDGDGADGWIAGQASGFFYNPYDMKIYIHLKFDNKKLGGTNVSLIRFDPSEANPALDLIDLGITSFYPELDHNNDYNYYLYNFNQPYINPYNNKIYLPNGAHSKVSVVDFEAREALLLDATEDNWISFPRTNNHPSQESISVVENNIQPFQNVSWSKISNLPFGGNTGTDELEMVYTDINDWNITGGLTQIHNVRGHKIQFLKSELEERLLFLEGTVINPGTAINKLYTDKENWTGYWLYPSQDIFDALGNAVDNLYSIEHQDWTCLKGLHFGIEPPDPTAEHLWYCDKTTHNIRYGEMVVLKTEEDINGFQWNIGGLIAAFNDPAQNPAYFAYEEQADYTSLLVELDSADQPIEIGAMINDSCIGATVVNPGDSIVVIRAYMENSTSDSVTFEKYYGTKSTARNRIGNYSVWDKNSKEFVKRALHANERGDIFFISLKKRKQENLKSNPNAAFVIWPNPASGTLFYSIVLEEDAHATISLFDIAGRLLARPVDEPLSSGKQKGVLLLKDDGGNNLLPGIYFVQLKAGGLVETKKVIVK